MSCVVCLEDYKGKKIVKVLCQYCPSNACRGCQQRYLLQSYEDPHCMECKRGWSSEFMAANFPLVFRNDALRKHRRKILLEREKAMLPAMQVFVEYKKNTARLEVEMNTLRAIFGDPYARPKTPEGIEAMRNTIAYRYMQMRDSRYSINSRIIGLNIGITNIKKQLADTAAATMPPTATPAEINERAEQLKNESVEIRGLRNERAGLKMRFNHMEAPFKQLDNEFKTKQAELATTTNAYWHNRRLYEGADGAAPQRREFIMKCADDTCRGFLSTSYKCGTCEKWTCSQCLVVIGLDKDAAHTCNPDTVETAKTIKAETRPCPKCGTRIFKIDGCDQMWCIMDGCHTAFSWNSGHVVTGTVHNPHYYEWLRRNGGGVTREVGDIPCGGLPAAYQLMGSLRPPYIPDEVRSTMMETHRNIRELIDMRLRDYPARQEHLANKDIDVAYLMQGLTEVEWQRQLELSEAKFTRKKEIGQILQTLATAGSDLMNFIVNQSTAMEGEVYAVWLATTATEQLEQLRIFGNESLKVLAKRDRMAVPQFDAGWKWKALRALYKPQKVAASPVIEA